MKDIRSQPPLPAPGVPRPDRRRQRTRSAIIAAGQHLFATHSLEGVSIDDIVAAADVAKGSFYNHFNDKAGLADAIVELVQGDVEFHVFAANRDTEDPARRVVRALAVVTSYARRNPDRVQALLSLSQRRADIDSPLNAGVVGDIEQGLASGRFKGVSREAGALVVLALARTAIDYLTHAKSNQALSAIVTDLGGAMLRALGVEAGEAADIAMCAIEILTLPEPAP